MCDGCRRVAGSLCRMWFRIGTTSIHWHRGRSHRVRRRKLRNFETRFVIVGDGDGRDGQLVGYRDGRVALVSCGDDGNRDAAFALHVRERGAEERLVSREAVKLTKKKISHTHEKTRAEW